MWNWLKEFWCKLFGKRDPFTEELITTAKAYFDSAYTKAGKNTEPPIVMSMHREFPVLKSDWERIFKKYKKKNLFMFSNFIHNHPRVKRIGAKDGCELGDLLYIHMDYKSNGEVIERALLYQVKTTTGDSVSDEQDILYSTWPDFIFTIPDYRNVISVNPKAAHEGARYLYIDNSSPTLVPEKRYFTKSLRTDLSKGSFFKELADLISSHQSTGRALKDDKGWEDTINIIKEYCKNKSYKGLGPRTLGLLLINNSIRMPVTLQEEIGSDGMLVIYFITADNINLIESWQA